MWQYWVLFAVPAFFALSRIKTVTYSAIAPKQDHWPFIWRVTYLVLVLMIGLRHEVGGDWYQYLAMLGMYEGTGNLENLKFEDPAFAFLNSLATWSGGGVYLVNLLSAIFFSWGLVIFCRAQPRPWLALVVAIPYLITVVAMGYTRQGIAIGIAMAGVIALVQGKIFRFFIWIILATLFHKSAIILVPLAIMARNKRIGFTLLWVVITIVIVAVLLLQEAASFLIFGYVENEYQSSGAAIRIAMNAFPGALFLFLNKRFQLSSEQRSFWKWVSWSALLFIPLLIVSPSSTPIDRLALYWIPLQLFVLSRLPSALGQSSGSRAFWVYVVVAYSATVHFVWLFFADTAFAWVPYQFYPWVWFWK